MRAGVLDEPAQQHYIGLQASTPFNTWLTENRRFIDAHLVRAYLRLGLGDEADKIKDAPKDPRPLQIPVDEDHPIISPYVDPIEEYRFAGSLFDLLPIWPTKIRESYSKK